MTDEKWHDVDDPEGFPDKEKRDAAKDKKGETRDPDQNSTHRETPLFGDDYPGYRPNVPPGKGGHGQPRTIDEELGRDPMTPEEDARKVHPEEDTHDG